MKRAVTLAIFAVAFALIPVTSAWAVWEGNAGIAAVGEFPGSGLFVRSDMFPKNTVVEIRNLENEKTAKAVVTGSSGVPGLVAMLSPQTADALGMKSGSVARVRISVPTVVERPAAGTYVEETSAVSEDPDANPAIAATEAVVPTDVAPTEAVAAADAVAPTETAEPTAALAEDETPVAEPIEEIAETEESAEIAASDETAEPETNASIAETEPEADTEVAPEVAEAAVEDTVAEAADAAETPEVVPAIVAAPESAEAIEATEATEPVDEPELAITDETAPVAEIVPVPEAEAVTGLDAAAVVAEAAPEAPSDETIVTLVPTDALPPEAPSVEPSSIPLIDAIAEATPEEPAVVAPVVEPIPVAPVATSTVDLPLIASLLKGSYYIQIGAYADAKNVRSILEKYGKKYPVAVEKTTTKTGECLKVYIGPVMKDEYGAVLEKFKANGFKDAFVRKGQ